MQFSTVLTDRHSTRDFDLRSIPESTLTAIVHDAQHTPSWANAQPWQVVVATGKTLSKIKQTFARRSQQGIGGSSDLEITHRTDWSSQPRHNMTTWNNLLGQYLYQSNLGTAAYGETQQTLFNAPALVYLIVPEPLNSWEIFDTGAFAQTLMLSAANHEVQSMPAYEIVKYPNELRQLLHLPSGMQILMGIALGYESSSPINKFRTNRVATSEILTIKH